MKALINTIYVATEGEGIFVGRPSIFVRFQGCAIGCVNCDSKETWAFKSSCALELEAVFRRVESLGRGAISWVSLTGGDPLHPRHRESTLALARGFKKRDFRVNLEASGNCVDPDIFGLVDLISFDVKTPSTGVSFPEELLDELIRDYPGRFQVKSVVENEEDFLFVEQRSGRLTPPIDFPWSLTPAYNPGESWPGERIEGILALNEKGGGPFRVICQQHKVLHGPNKRGV